jgi:undecaprenyl phosphate-alpha-L-ara4N flippase subunit ArnF
MKGATQAKALRRARAWCVGSIVLASSAQLALKWAVQQLPPLSLEFVLLIPALRPGLALALLFLGLCCYAVSMLCWFQALRWLPLSYAYSMLSLSYVLVYLLAAVLPWFAESVTILKTAGVALIMFGVRLIHTSGEETEKSM